MGEDGDGFDQNTLHTCLNFQIVKWIEVSNTGNKTNRTKKR